jgi:sialate O-acetylesterase
MTPQTGRRVLVLALLLAGLMPAARADVRLAKIFTDNMMLQRDQPIRVWGWAATNEAVTVTLGGQKAATTADAQGKWRVELPARKKGENLTLTIAGQNTLVRKNIIMGDIWLCSGQSNMEWFLTKSYGGERAIAEADYPRIRSYKVPHLVSAKPEEDLPGDGWNVCTPQTAGGAFTAVGFYFAREVSQRTGVPIGLLDDNWGGTAIEPWTPAEGVALVPAVSALSTNWSGIYHAMIHPIIRFPIKGALWYQGESNGTEGDSYALKMRALIGGWRKLWGIGDFPFYYVQLTGFTAVQTAPAGGDGWARLREAQAQVLAVTNTGMAVTLDVGDAADIHPRNKLAVGQRLARWALARDYGMQELEPCSPLYRSQTVEGHRVRLAFDHAGGGLMVGKKFNFGALAQTPQEAALPRLGAVTCDGELTEWRDAAAVPLRLASDTAHRKPPHVWNGPADCSMEVLCGWSAEGLCLGGTVADDDVRNSRPNDVSYEQDCVEFYVDGRIGAAFQKPPYSKGAYHIFVRPPVGDAPVTLVCNSDKAAITNARVAGKRSAHGWTFEVVIPWEAFPGFRAQPDASFGLQFGIDDYDSRDGDALQPLMMSVRGATSLFMNPQKLVKWTLGETLLTGEHAPLDAVAGIDLPRDISSGDRVDIAVAMGRMPGERPPVRSGAYTIKERTGAVVAQGVAKFGKSASPWRQSIEGEFTWKLKGVADGIYDVEVRLADVHGTPLGVLREQTMVRIAAMSGRVEEDKGAKPAGFAIAGADKVWHWAEATLEDGAVVVASDKVAAPVAVRYGYAANPEAANLYSKDGLPVGPFRTDNW